MRHSSVRSSLRAIQLGCQKTRLYVQSVLIHVPQPNRRTLNQEKKNIGLSEQLLVPTTMAQKDALHFGARSFESEYKLSQHDWEVINYDS